MKIKSLLFACLAFCLIPVAAFAQEVASDTIINLGDLVSPWLQLLFAAAATIVPAAAIWAAAELRRRTGISIERSHREAFQTALTNAAGLALASAAKSAQTIKFDVGNPVVKQAIGYINKAAPDALAYFELRPDQLAEKLAAKIGVMTATEVVTSGETNAAGDTLVGRINL